MIAFGISFLAILVAGLTVALIGRAGRTALTVAAVVVVILIVGEYALASAGILKEWTRRPPPFLIAVSVPIVVALATAFSRIGARIAASASFAAIIGIQAFRLPLELVMHQAAATGLMPAQMSYGGRNFDIVTGILAIPVALLAMRRTPPRAAILAWNIIGTLLLVNIVAVAVASTPLFAAFGPDRLNTWLPTVLVPAAAFGHALTWRKLA